MDFSNNVFQPAASNSHSLSGDTMAHTNLVMACQFGWTAGPANDAQTPATSQSLPPPTPLTLSSNVSNNKRFSNCRGRLYHQLTCGHRIRTDIVGDCGSNCLDPLEDKSDLPFYCHECVEKQTKAIWDERESQHNASYPPISQMTSPQYEQWYDEHRQLEAQFTKDCRVYESQLKSNTRPSNVCSVAEGSKEDMEFAAELDSLSLAMSSSGTDGRVPQPRVSNRALPTDPAEQLHWGLSALSIDRGSCGVEYSTHQAGNNPTANRSMGKEELWGRPRN